MKNRKQFVLEQGIVEQRIFIIHGHRVMLSPHLAELYEVPVRALIQAVKRNIERFPEDFMFQLTWPETEKLASNLLNSRSQFVILKQGRNIKYLPYAFTEQGVAMLSSILKSKRAILVNVQIMRTFTKLRRLLFTNEHLRRKIEEMERKYDSQFKVVFDAIRQLLAPPVKPKESIGFRRLNT